MSPQIMNGKQRPPLSLAKFTRSPASSNNHEAYRGNYVTDSSGLSFSSSKSKAFRCRFFVNGDKHFNGIYYVINLDRLRTLDSLCTELSRILVNVKSLPSGVRIIFNCEDGTKIDSIEQFNHNENYVCSSTDHFIRLDYYSIRLTPPLQLNSSQMNHSPQDHFQDESAIHSNCELTNYENTKKPFMRLSSKKLTAPIKNANNTNSMNLVNSSNESNSSSQTLSTRATLSPNSFVTLRPKLVALLRGSCRAEPSMRPSRRVFRFLLNHRIAQNYEQLLNEISKCVKLNVGAVHRVYGLYSKKINCLSDFYDNESVYLVYGRSEKCNVNDFLLDDYEQREIASIIGSSYLNIFYQEMSGLHDTNRMAKKDGSIKRTVKICDDINNNISATDETNSLQLNNIIRKKDALRQKDIKKCYYPQNNLKNQKILNENNNDIKANSLPASFCKNIEPQYDCDNIQDSSISLLIEQDKEKMEKVLDNEVKPLKNKNTIANLILNGTPNKHKKIILKRKIINTERNIVPLSKENENKEINENPPGNILSKNCINYSLWSNKNSSDNKKNTFATNKNKATNENNFQAKSRFCFGDTQLNCFYSDSGLNSSLVFEKDLLHYTDQKSNATTQTSNCNLIKSGDLLNFGGNTPGGASSISCSDDFCFVSGSNTIQNKNCNFNAKQIMPCTNNSPIVHETHSFTYSDSDDSSAMPLFSSLSGNILLNETISFENEADSKNSNDEDEDIEVSYVLKPIDNINDENEICQTTSNLSDIKSIDQSTSFTAKQQNKLEYLNVASIGNYKNTNLAPKLTQIPPSTKFHPKKEVNEVYFVDKLIGDGKFGVVYTCIHRTSRQSYALKVVDKYMMKQVLFNQNEDDNAVNSEVEILTRVDHPNIVKLYQHFDYVDESYLVLELLQGGDLFDAISVASKYGESEAATMISDLLNALNYLHRLNIVHRDVKLENLLVFYETINCQKMSRDISNDLHSYNFNNQLRQYRRRVKLADFGLAVEIKNNEKLFTVCGTPTYVAPEILLEVGYSFPVDIWAAGVILFILLSGLPPFLSDENDQAQLFDQIISGKFEFSPIQWRSVSDNAKRMIQSMLCVHQSKRITASQLLKHVWLNNFNSNIN